MRMRNLWPFGSSIIWAKWNNADGLDQIQRGLKFGQKKFIYLSEKEQATDISSLGAA